MKLSILVLFMALAAITRADDAYTVDKATIESVDVYYPKSFEESYAALPAGAKFPGVIISLGANVDKSYYSEVATKIAASGYIVAVPTAVLFPMFNLKVSNPQSLNDTRALLIAQSSLASSPIFGLLETDNFHLLGHSLGGSLAIVAASKNAQAICTTTALALFCGGYTGNGSEYQSVAAFGTALFGIGPPVNATNSAAVALIYGTTDARLPNSSVAATYSFLLQAPKVFVTIDDVNHLGITDTQAVPGQFNNGLQEKSQGWSTSMISKVSVVLFDAYGKNSTAAYDKLYGRKNLGPKALTLVSSQA